MKWVMSNHLLSVLQSTEQMHRGGLVAQEGSPLERMLEWACEQRLCPSQSRVGPVAGAAGLEEQGTEGRLADTWPRGGACRLKGFGVFFLRAVRSH